jgi:hypothetical protein
MFSSICDHIGPIHFEVPSMIDDGFLSPSGTHLQGAQDHGD